MCNLCCKNPKFRSTGRKLRFDRDILLIETNSSEFQLECGTLNDGIAMASLSEDTFHILRAAAIEAYGKLGVWTYDAYAELNRRYFDGLVVLKTVQWGITPYGGSLGFYNPAFDTIMLHQSIIKSSSAISNDPWGLGHIIGKRLAYDVLLHEMIHQFLFQQGAYAPDDDAHNCQAWCDELNRIGRILGLDSYHTPLRKTTKRVILEHETIKGKYCDLGTHRVRQPPKIPVSVWVPLEKEAEEKAKSLGVNIATHKHLSCFPYTVRPREYYSQREQYLVKETYLNND